MHQGISSNLILFCFSSIVGNPDRNDFHPFNKLMRYIHILLHVIQKNLKNFFVTPYFSMKLPFRQVFRTNSLISPLFLLLPNQIFYIILNKAYV